jgi:Ca2+-binding RTX toxin-like protein
LTRHMRRAAPGFVIAIFLMLAPAALASTVDKVGGKVIWTADASRNDSTNISQASNTPNQVTIDNNDTIVLTAAAQADCSSNNPNSVTCNNVTEFEGNSLDGGDYLNAGGLITIPATLNAGDGNDTVYGGDGADTINGGAGDDAPYYWYCEFGSPCGGLFGGNGNDTINGGSGVDFIVGENGNDTLDGGPGNDAPSFFFGGPGLGSSISSVDAQGCSCLFGVVDGGNGNDTVTGGDGIDWVLGDSGNDHVNGGAGDDSVSGGNDDDVVTGGDGNDSLSGDDGSDLVSGGNGDDYAYEYDDNAPDTIHGDAGQDTVDYESCCDTEDTINVTLDDVANDGSGFNDPNNNVAADNENVIVNNDNNHRTYQYSTPAHIVGNAAANVLSGSGGADTIDGGGGADRLEGYDGPDTFVSRDGFPDYVACGAGIDSVTADQFDTFELCENIDVATLGSAYDVKDPPAPPPPLPDRTGPATKLTGPSQLTIDQFLKGFNVGVSCDEDCTIQGRLLASQPAGDVHLAKSVGFNLVLGRKTLGFGKGVRKVLLRPCTPIKSSAQKRDCLARMRRSATRKGRFTVKVYVVTTDRFGNRSEKTKLIKVHK